MSEWNSSGIEVLLFDPSIEDCDKLIGGLDNNVQAIKISGDTFLSIFSDCLTNPLY